MIARIAAAATALKIEIESLLRELPSFHIFSRAVGLGKVLVWIVAIGTLSGCLMPRPVSVQDQQKGQSLETCTLLGCELMSATISIQRQDGKPPNFTATVVMDTDMIQCPLPVVTDYPGDIPSNCTPLVNVIVQPLTVCADQKAAFPFNHLKCPFERKYEEVVHIHGVPRRVTLVLWQGKRKLAEKVFRPDYKLDYPNGERCGHPCKYWRTTWMLD
jgi:hypothetical protein